MIYWSFRFCKSKGYTVRFYRIYGKSSCKRWSKRIKFWWDKANCFTKISKLLNVPRDNSSPSQYYELEDGYQFGIIEPHKDDFVQCNRIRLTAEGYLIPCLYFEDAMSIKDAVQNNRIDEAVDI